MKHVIFFIENNIEDRHKEQPGILNLWDLKNAFLKKYLWNRGSKWNYKCILIKQDAVECCKDEFPKDIKGWDIILIDDRTAKGTPIWNDPDQIGVIYHSYPNDFPKEFPYKNQKQGAHEKEDPFYGPLRKLIELYNDATDRFDKEQYAAALGAILDLFQVREDFIGEFLEDHFLKICTDKDKKNLEDNNFKIDKSDYPTKAGDEDQYIKFRNAVLEKL